MTDPGEHEELLRRFRSVMDGADVADLRRLAGDLALFARDNFDEGRPRLRRPPLEEVSVFRVRADLAGAKPPIWRRVELRSDLTLDRVHEVLQVAFEWTDSHLHRFSIGGDPFDRASELFLCPWDVEEGDDEGTPTNQVRLDETIQQPGDVLRYVYDYGDSWDITLRLERITPAGDSTPPALFTAGRGTAPEEDSRSVLLESDDLDPGDAVAGERGFDPGEANQSLQNPLGQLQEADVDPRLISILQQSPRGPIRDRLAVAAFGLTIPAARPDDGQTAAALTPVVWFLARASGDGIALTSAGYLPPDDVAEAAGLLPQMRDWIGKNNRENLAIPLLDFRLQLQYVGLLRKYRGRLLTTRAGQTALRHPDRLWLHLAQSLVPARTDSFEHHAALLTLLAAITAGPDGFNTGLADAATALTELGWSTHDGQPLRGHDIANSPHNPLTLLTNLDPTPTGRTPLGPVAVTLARDALTTLHPDLHDRAAG